MTKAIISVISVMVIGLLSFSTGLASVNDIHSGIAVFADKGGNGNGQGNGNNGQGQGKNGQSQEQEQDNNGDNGNNGQSQDQEQVDNGNNGQGQDENIQGDNGQGIDDQGQNQDQNGTPVPDEHQNKGGDKVGICHRTGSASNPFVFIEVNEHAVPAHEAHGDTIGVSSAADCQTSGTPPPVTGTPIPGGTPPPITGTPVATPIS